MKPLPNNRNESEYWQGRAEEARVVAEGMKCLAAREMMFRTVKSYEMMAKTLEKIR